MRNGLRTVPLFAMLSPESCACRALARNVHAPPTMKPIALFTTCLLATGAFGADTQSVSDRRIQDSAGALSEMMDAKERGLPGLKRAGFIVGAKYGKGVITCRVNNSLGWSAPSTIRIEGGNVGFQIGLGETDLIFVVMNKKGEVNLIKDKFTIGSEASAMIGPVGRATVAETDPLLRAEILGYSRSRGIFAGISLDGATLRPDKGDNRKIYGVNATQAQILHGEVPPPLSADELYAELNRYAPVKTTK
jgi:SH3 domain-containing YSC84-like protein 1